MTFTTAATEKLRITSDGRGLSQFTAKAWCTFNGTGTPTIIDSHNVSTITDVATGIWEPNFTNAMVNANYSCFVGQMNNAVNNNTGNTIHSRTTTKARVSHFENNALTDLALMDFLVFGD